MKMSLTVFLCGAGLVLVTAGSACAQGSKLALRYGTMTHTLNNGSSQGGHAWQANLPDSSIGRYYMVPTANDGVCDATTTATLNAGSATLAGVVTLLLLQQRPRTNPVLKSKS